jgi:hypothetical protein
MVRKKGEPTAAIQLQLNIKNKSKFSLFIFERQQIYKNQQNKRLFVLKWEQTNLKELSVCSENLINQ